MPPASLLGRQQAGGQGDGRKHAARKGRRALWLTQQQAIHIEDDVGHLVRHLLAGRQAGGGRWQ